MIHPIIVTLPELTLRQGSKDLIATIYDPSDGTTFSIPLPTGHVERILSNILLHIHSGLSLPKITSHFSSHTHADPHCPCCKLEGRLVSAQGRRPVSDTDRIIAARRVSGGKVEIRHIKPRLSGAQLRAYEEAYFKRQPKPKKPQTNYPEPVKFVPHNIEDLI